MDMDFSKFYDFLMESGEQNAISGGFKGKTFAELAPGGWYYIPFPTNGADFGSEGKGTGEYKILVRERGDKWDMFLFKKGSTAITQAIPDSSVADAANKMKAVRARAQNTKLATDDNAHTEMQRLMNLSESYFAGTLNEAAEGDSDNGDTAMLGDKTWGCTHAEVGHPFEQILKLCVTAVTGKNEADGSSNLLKAMVKTNP